MLVERRKAQMPLLLQARVALVWLMISSILLVASLGLSAVQSTVPVDDLGPLIPLLGSIIERQLAIVVGLVALPLLALGIAMFLAARIAWRVSGDRDVTLTCLAMGLSAPLLFHMAPMQAGSYGWQVVCALTAVNGLVTRNQQMGAWVIGLAIAVLLAISLDSWPFIIPIIAIAALKWLRNRADCMWLVRISQSLAAGSIVIYLGIHGLTGLGIYCGQLGPVHIAMMCWTALILAALSRTGPIPAGTLLAGFAVTVGGAVGILLLAGQSCRGETIPIWQLEPDFILQNLALPIVGIWAAIHLAARNVDWLRRWWLDYSIMLVAALVVVILTSRGGAIIAALAAAPVGWQLRIWLDNIAQMANPIRRAASLALIAAVLMPTLPLGVMPKIEQARANQIAAEDKVALGMILPNDDRWNAPSSIRLAENPTPIH